MKLATLAAVMAVFSFPALAANDLPEGFETFMDDLDFAYTHCTMGMYRIAFDKDVLNQVSQKLYDMRQQAEGDTPLLSAPTPDPTSAKERCFDLRNELGAYAKTVLGIPGLVKP